MPKSPEEVEFIRDHLAELCVEVLGWKRTGMLAGDRLQEFCSRFYAHLGHLDLQIAEEAVKEAAMRHVIECGGKP